MLHGREFTAHNIRLDNGELTMPSAQWEFTQQPVLRSTQRFLRTLYPGGFRGKRIVDLGCLEGGYAVEFARMGFDALGIEVRKSNFANCIYVKERVDLPNLTFVNDDVWSIEQYGHFDIVFCCGLFYHLDRPVEFLNTLSRVCSDAVILNTHCASMTGNHGQPAENFVEHEGVCGTWYHEYQPDQIEELDDLKWHSWSNSRSFWPTRESLPGMLRAAGFDLIFEQFDWLDGDITASMSSGYYAQDSRVMFVGVKTRVPGSTDSAGLLERENKALRAEIEALRGSTSWLMTAPLRTLSRKLRPRNRR